MKAIAIYGAGGFGREVACLLREINEVTPTWNFIGFFDDRLPAGTAVGKSKVLGDMVALNAWEQELAVAFAIAKPKTLKSLVAAVKNPRIEFPNLIAPDVHFRERESVRFGRGNIINTRSAISCDCVFGDFNLSVFDNVFGHDMSVGNFNVFFTGTRLSGRVQVGDENVFGASSTVLQNLSVGNRNTLGGASLLVASVKDDATLVGVPAKKFSF